MSNKELKSKIKAIKRLKTKAEDIQRQINSLQDEIKAYMTAADLDSLQVDIFKVSYKAVTQSRFNTTAFKKDHGDIYALYQMQTTTRRFIIR